MTVNIPMRGLSRKQRAELGDDVGGNPDLAQDLVAQEYQMVVRDEEAEWYDVRTRDGSTKGEVKSTQGRIGEDYPADGRFRVRRDQTRSLIASDAQNTAWYFFVLFDDDVGGVRIQRRKPSTVLRLINERGGWNDAGHHEFAKQHKLPIGAVMNG